MQGDKCPEEFFVCLTEDEYWELEDALMDLGYEYDAAAAVVQPLSDAEVIADLTWQILFLEPWELAYIALPMSVLAFYGLTIYLAFKWIQRKFS